MDAKLIEAISVHDVCRIYGAMRRHEVTKFFLPEFELYMHEQVDVAADVLEAMAAKLRQGCRKAFPDGMPF